MFCCCYFFYAFNERNERRKNAFVLHKFDIWVKHYRSIKPKRQAEGEQLSLSITGLLCMLELFYCVVNKEKFGLDSIVIFFFMNLLQIALSYPSKRGFAFFFGLNDSHIGYMMSTNNILGDHEPTPPLGDASLVGRLDSALNRVDALLNYSQSMSSSEKDEVMRNFLLKPALKLQHTKKRGRKRVSFDSQCKPEDGFTAKLYSRPEYLMRDGSFLRPKSEQHIAQEKRILRLLGAPEDLAGLPLPPGLFDEDTEEYYEPEQPNDYEAFVQARNRLQEWIQSRDIQRQMAAQRALLLSQQAEMQSVMSSKLETQKKKKKIVQ
ncbi:hypothetical protein RFI_20093 [Reticulomyxa filosa]|uniref:Uncharacterized protein n=1 Tax=Reticulomyxa filosa TaxID=46433 RepID=X6MU83_RETFI|nr:hypothetical protein RFI_20093 [Reticulomyxa filosa]|eukprot:ETO17236.1 hypothetical protein RFI_20093 [Reticulomyxa filosa]